jgi:preprotein translocase subunit YajC
MMPEPIEPPTSLDLTWVPLASWAPPAHWTTNAALAPWSAIQEGAAPPAGATGQTAPAEGGADAPKKAPGLFDNMMFPMLAIFAIFYFVMIAPERKARKKRESMLGALKKGDKVLTSSGMYAVVAAVGEDGVTLQIDDGVRVRFTRAAIQTVLETEAPAAAK